MLKFPHTVKNAATAGALMMGLAGAAAVALAPQMADAQMHSSTGFHRDWDGRGFHRDWDDRAFHRDWDDRWHGGWGWGPRVGIGVGFYGYPYYGGYYPYGCDYDDYYYGYCSY